MKISARLAAPALLLLILAVSANAQMGRPPRISGVWNPVVGAGAAYEVDSKGDKTEMEISIIGKESVGGKDAYWYEMSFNSAHAGGQMVMKSLTVVNGADTQVTRMIMQMPGRPPMEMPAQIVLTSLPIFAATRKIWAVNRSPCPPALSLASTTARRRTRARPGFPKRSLPTVWSSTNPPTPRWSSPRLSTTPRTKLPELPCPLTPRQ